MCYDHFRGRGAGIGQYPMLVWCEKLTEETVNY
jgi:hypothetical protein